MRYFRFEAVEDGVWAAICQDPTYAMSNAAVVDLGNKTLVFDSSMSPVAAQELRNFAQEATQKPVSYVVNSHHHLDHCLGNQIFADTTIISSSITKDLMQARFARLESENPAEAIPDLKQQTASTAWEQNLLALELAELEMLHAFLPSFKPTPPSLTFSNSLELIGSKRTAKIQTFGRGHTTLDAVLVVNDVLITGDLVLSQHLAFMAHGDPDAWLKRLDNLEQIQGIQHLIPGHGEVGTPRLLEDMRHQLLEMMALGSTTQHIATAQPPAHWLLWGLPASYRYNLEFLQGYQKTQIVEVSPRNV